MYTEIKSAKELSQWINEHLVKINNHVFIVDEVMGIKSHISIPRAIIEINSMLAGDRTLGNVIEKIHTYLSINFNLKLEFEANGGANILLTNLIGLFKGGDFSGQFRRLSTEAMQAEFAWKTHDDRRKIIERNPDIEYSNSKMEKVNNQNKADYNYNGYVSFG